MKKAIRIIILHFVAYLLTSHLMTNNVYGQFSLTSFPYNQDFNTTSSTSLPSGWQIYSKNTSALSGTADTVKTGGISSSATGQACVYYYSATPDGGIGFLTTGTFGSSANPTLQIQFAFTNNTGSTINSLNVSVGYMKYRTGTTHETFSFTGSSGIVPSSLSYTYTADASVTSGTLPGTLVSTNTGTITGLNIANGSTYTLTWSLSGGGANGHALGIDNFVVSLPAITGTYLPLTGGTVNGTVSVTNGSLGIGATPPLTKLHINNGTSKGGLLIQNNNGTTGSVTRLMGSTISVAQPFCPTVVVRWVSA